MISDQIPQTDEGPYNDQTPMTHDLIDEDAKVARIVGRIIIAVVVVPLLVACVLLAVL